MHNATSGSRFQSGKTPPTDRRGPSAPDADSFTGGLMRDRLPGHHPNNSWRAGSFTAFGAPPFRSGPLSFTRPAIIRATLLSVGS